MLIDICWNFSNTVLEAFNTVLEAFNTVLEAFNTVLEAFNTLLKAFNIVLKECFNTMLEDVPTHVKSSLFSREMYIRILFMNQRWTFN